MPDSPLVTLTVWKDAVKNPPDNDRYVTTDLGVAHYIHGDWWRHNSERTHYQCLADPQPSVWCDPLPPGDDALTVEHLHIALRLMAGHRGHGIPPEQIADAMRCLRRALESLER